MEVLLSYQLEVFLNGFSGNGVFSEDQDIMLSTTIHLRHHQVSQKILAEECLSERKDLSKNYTLEETTKIADIFGTLL